jgi:superoxide dismutase, Cu-Zn family
MSRSVHRYAGWGVALVLLAATLFIVNAPPSGARETPLTWATMRDANGHDIGKVTFLGWGRHATKVLVSLRLPAGAVGLGQYHGLHVHTVGECVAPFTTAGGHWDDGTHVHGGHLGDLPSVLIGADGAAELTAAVDRVDIGAIRGRAVILHAGRDNFGNVPVGGAVDQYSANSDAAVTATNNTGNAGARQACGVIR